MSNNLTNLVEASQNIVDLDAGQIFSGKPSGTTIKGYGQPCAYTPAIDPDYIFHESSRDEIVWFLDPREPLYVFGPTGCGKTSSIKQLAARLNYPVFEISGHGRLEFADLVGHLSVQNGSMTFEYGPLALAMHYGGLCLFNEIDLTSPEVAAGLHNVLDGSPLCIAENGGELITPHPMFRFVATANTNGGGDDTGLYQGTQRQNLAFADRFMLCEVGYPAPAVEVKLLMQRFSALPASLCKTMVVYANEVRKLFMGDSTDAMQNTMEVTFSTRSLLRWADLTVRFQPLAKQGIQPVTYALDRALAFRATRESRAMLHELAQRHFPLHQEKQKQTPAENATPDIGLSGDSAIHFMSNRLATSNGRQSVKIYLRKKTHTAQGDSSKDWIGETSTQGMNVRFGRTGTNGQQRFFELNSCREQNPLRELEVRATKKLREGYSLIPEKSVW